MFAEGLRKMDGKEEQKARSYMAVQGGFSICGKWVETGLGADADSPILAGGLVAEAGGSGETVKVAPLWPAVYGDRQESKLPRHSEHSPCEYPSTCGFPRFPMSLRHRMH